jgi:predicted dehydrogenase
MFSRIALFAFCSAAVVSAAQGSTTDPPLRVAIAGLVHGHVGGFIHLVKSRNDVQVVGIFDPDRALQQKYAQSLGITNAQCFSDLNAMLVATHPEAVATFTSTSDHLMVVKAAAQRRIPVMMEKPMAINNQQAKAIQFASRESGIPIIVNYETTWYRSHAEMWRLLKEQHAAGEIRKMVAMDGHPGPKEINVGPEFFAWLTNPAKNGAGALFDFGCYGANLMTWMMDNQRPLRVTAITQTYKPQTYAGVDDDANVLVEYLHAAGIIQGSWNWPYSRKDFEVYGERGYAIAVGGSVLKTRIAEAHQTNADSAKEVIDTPPALPLDETDSVAYLRAVVRGRIKPSGLSSVENNMIVVEILDAARESARTGKAVNLK